MLGAERDSLGQDFVKRLVVHPGILEQRSISRIVALDAF